MLRTRRETIKFHSYKISEMRKEGGKGLVFGHEVNLKSRTSQMNFPPS